MSNRHERRKAAATSAKKSANLNAATLDQHLDETLRRLRAEFERTGAIHSRFECVTDAESFEVPAHWPDHNAKGAACAALRDTFRRRGVNRYIFASEVWVGKSLGLRPTDDPDRGEGVQVVAVERNGPRRYAFAEITRNGGGARAVGRERRRFARLVAGVVRGWLFRPITHGRAAASSRIVGARFSIRASSGISGISRDP